MSDSRAEDLREADDVVTQLKTELRRLIDSKWEGNRKDFRLRKKLVSKLLNELIRDVRSIRFK